MAPKVLPLSETKLRTIVSNTGCTSVGELEIIPKISAVAVCCSSASASLFFRSALFRSASAARRRSTGVLAFVVFERRRLMPVRLFAPLRDKATPAARRSTEALLADRPLKHNTAGSAVREAAYVGATNGKG